MTDEPLTFDPEGVLIDATIEARRSNVGSDRRTGIRAEQPGPEDYDEDGWRGLELTPIEVRTLAEYVEHGTMAGAARCLNRSLQTIKNRVTVIHVKTGSPTTIEALRRLGWLTVPAGAFQHGAIEKASIT